MSFLFQKKKLSLKNSILIFFADEASSPAYKNDILVAFDSSACFRDHHRKMIKFVTKLAVRIARVKGLEYGANTRLGILQVS